ncbi:polysaccharide biosynthesis protein [Thermoleophilia bacterium SCSIO 60948]|nr:polysaccharide biosynthesis protein [Thermoleophilia bacterium SCSIO 60948]
MARGLDPAIRRRAMQIAIDALLAAAAFFVAFNLRFLDAPGGIPAHYEEFLWSSIAVVAVGQALVFELLGQHGTWWRYFRLPDLWPLVRAAVVAVGLTVVLFAIIKPFPDDLPRSVAIFDLLLLVVFCGGVRLARRTISERPARGLRSRSGREVLVVGAGSGGQMVVRELQLNPALGLRPMGFVDDDPKKRGMHNAGLRVLGTTEQIESILDRHSPEEVVIAIPSAPGTLRAKVVAAASERGIQVRTLPTVFELLRGGVQLTRQLREVQVEDVLGRDPVVMELDRVGAYMRDRVVMVTGAGGSIGSELCRQIARVHPSRLVMVDRAEDNLFEIDRELREVWHFADRDAVLADCRHGERMLEVMQRHRPDVVFHAAAYKHVPLMEANPLEAIRNNTIATQVVAKTAAAAGTERFVLVSTDKAVEPHTVMGASKAMAEWVVESLGRRNPQTRFAIVRFGNVLASSGSVVPIFREQIERGGPVTVTHPEMTRYFMTIPEATQLVIQAGDLGSVSGEIFVLEMGEPVRILDLAHNMIRLAGQEPEIDIAITFTGPRPGEKLHEQLLNPEERAQPTSAERIIRAVREPLDPDWVETTIGRIESLAATTDEPDLGERIVRLIAAERASLAAGDRG